MLGAGVGGGADGMAVLFILTGRRQTDVEAAVRWKHVTSHTSKNELLAKPGTYGKNMEAGDGPTAVSNKIRCTV